MKWPDSNILLKGITGNLYSNKGYISGKLGKKLMDRGLQLSQVNEK